MIVCSNLQLWSQRPQLPARCRCHSGGTYGVAIWDYGIGGTVRAKAGGDCCGLCAAEFDPWNASFLVLLQALSFLL